jgi:hypothetical protein
VLVRSMFSAICLGVRPLPTVPLPEAIALYRVFSEIGSTCPGQAWPWDFNS